MESIVFLERNTFSVEFRRPRLDHTWVEHGETQPDQVVERLSDATIAIVNKLPLREPELRLLTKLKLIAVAATGVDNIDLEFCLSRRIAVSNVRNYARHSLSEHVLMLMLALRRRIISYHEDVRRGEWQQARQFCLLNYPIHDLFGSTLGIVGFGFLGQAVAALGRGVGMQVLVAERKDAETVREGRNSFEDVLRQSDVITLHCPLTSETENLIGARALNLMKPNALLINTARGGLVNERDLLQALTDGRIGGAAVDVLRNEPPRDGNLLLSANLPNLIVTPHIAWASQEAMRTLADQVVENIEAFVRGESKNRVV
jgi:glycerate dehydrogenase